jgi:hypothetical protein
MTPVRAAWPLLPAGEPLLPFVTIGTVAEPFAMPGGTAPAAGAGFAEPSPGTDGSLGGGAIPGARVNFGGDGASAGTAARPAASRPAGAEPSLLGSLSTGVVEVPEPPDFAVVSVIN